MHRLNKRQDEERDMLENRLRKEYDKLQNSLREDPGNAVLYKEIGNIFYTNDISVDIAERYYLKAETIDSFDPDIQHNLGLVEVEKGENWKAIQKFSKSIRIRKKRLDKRHVWRPYFRQNNPQDNKDIEFVNDAYRLIEASARKLLNTGVSNSKLNKSLAFKEEDILGDNIKTSSTIVDVTLADFRNYKDRMTIHDIFQLKANQIDETIANNYPDRFDARDIIRLNMAGISPRKASLYDKRLRVPWIIDLHKKNISPNRTKGYHKRFDVDITSLVENNISPSMANKYDRLFSGSGIAEFVRMNISPDKVPKYAKRFDGEDILALIKAKVNNSEAKKFDKRMKGEDIASVVRNGNSYGDTLGYDKRFDSYDIKNLILYECDSDKANRFDKRFSGRTVSDLVYSGISPERANSYDKRFYGDQIIDMISKKLPPEEANKWLEVLSAEKIAELYKKIPLKMAAKYPERYSYLDILIARGNGLSPAKANKFNPKISVDNLLPLIRMGVKPEKTYIYDERFDGESIYHLLYHNIDPQFAKSYDKRFNGLDISGFFLCNIKNEDAIKYSGQYDGGGIADLITYGINPEGAKKYSTRFGGQDISKLVEKGISPRVANAYQARFETWGIIKLKENNVSPAVANRYPYRFWATDIIDLIKNGIKPKEAFKYHNWVSSRAIILLRKMNNERILDTIDSDITLSLMNSFNEMFRMEEVEKGPLNYRIIGAGSSSAIMLNKKQKTCYKFSQSYEEEVKVLKKIEESGKDFENIISLKQIKEAGRLDRIIELEYIEGKNIEEIVSKKKIPYKDAVTYTKGILQGLIDLRSIGIKYHRDIRPSNILIDSKKNIPVIIDLEYASKKEYEREDGNRRFNGPNDLSSAGQTLYYMVTGTNPFAASKYKHSDLSDIADEIEERRDAVYADKTGVLMDLLKQKVDYTIRNKKLAGLIKELLTAGPEDHERVQSYIESP